MSKFTSEDVYNLNTALPMPKNPKQIVIIVAGGIVSDAHLPAYKKSGFKVLGIFDPLKDKADKCAKDYLIPKQILLFQLILICCLFLMRLEH